MNKNLIFKIAKVDRKLALWLARKAVLLSIRKNARPKAYKGLIFDTRDTFCLYIKARINKQLCVTSFRNANALVDACNWYEQPIPFSRFVNVALSLGEIRRVGSRILPTNKDGERRGLNLGVMYDDPFHAGMSYIASFISAQVQSRLAHYLLIPSCTPDKPWHKRRLEDAHEVKRSCDRANIEAKKAFLNGMFYK